MSSITEMVQFRLEGWDKSIGSWLEVEVEASSFEDAAQIAKYRDNFERIIDTQAMSIDRRSERRNENSREKLVYRRESTRKICNRSRSLRTYVQRDKI